MASTFLLVFALFLMFFCQQVLVLEMNAAAMQPFVLEHASTHWPIFLAELDALADGRSPP